MPHMVHLRLLGDFSLVVEGAPVQSIAGTRLQALLAYLALHAGTAVPRQQIALLFWPDSSEAQARNNLRQIVYLLRRLFPVVDRYLHVDATTLCWQPDTTFSLDTVDFQCALAHAAQSEQIGDENSVRDALIQALGLYQGDLLPGCYDDGIVPEREQLCGQYLTPLISCSSDAGPTPAPLAMLSAGFDMTRCTSRATAA
jgi:DNA-binding SARP family transcriptional activator